MVVVPLVPVLVSVEAGVSLMVLSEAFAEGVGINTQAAPLLVLSNSPPNIAVVPSALREREAPSMGAPT